MIVHSVINIVTLIQLLQSIDVGAWEFNECLNYLFCIECDIQILLVHALLHRKCILVVTGGID